MAQHWCSQCGQETIGQSYSHCIDHRKPVIRVESYTVWAWEGHNTDWDNREIKFSITFKSLEHAKLFASALTNADDITSVEIENELGEMVEVFHVLQSE